MTESLTTCPTDDELAAWVDGPPQGDDLSAVTMHVDGCVSCQRKLELLVMADPLWKVSFDHLKYELPNPAESSVSDLIKRMKSDLFFENSSSPHSAAYALDFLAPSDYPGSIGKLGQYEVTEVIGQGGMGIVLKAFDSSLHRVVAVKVLAPYLAHNAHARKRFVREAQAIAAVSHEHVIAIHAIDGSSQQPTIVMPYIPGCSLQQKLDAEGALDLAQILRIGLQTAAGLAAAHAQGLVHRDIKPSNILLENSVQRVKLTDFGLARAVDDASLTQSGVIAGTPQYMAPEQANGNAVDFRADLFSLGSVLYAMSVGHSPFRASTTMGVLKRVCHDAPQPIQELNPAIPDWFCAIVMKLLEKNSNDRYATAQDVAELLENCLAHIQRPHVVPEPSGVDGRATSSAVLRNSFFRRQLRSVETQHHSGTSRPGPNPPQIRFHRATLALFISAVVAGVLLTMFITSLNPKPQQSSDIVTIGTYVGLGCLLFAAFRIAWDLWCRKKGPGQFNP